MKKQFTVSVKVAAYSQADAQAKVDLLLQMGAFIKDFNVNNLAGSLLTSLLTSTVAKVSNGIVEKRQKEKDKESLQQLGFAIIPPKKKEKTATH
ncbi:hypothetical protein [Pseudocnuella soli]|uniref:hypothetical protein n=1 Tax=Pseudocnuella soli TaxID=2502779 RepID=UPI00104B362D|nr:hypothetical protein [Pseudocnuella soli]